MYYVVIPFLLFGSLAKFTNNRIQKKTNFNNNQLQLKVESFDKLNKNSKTTTIKTKFR